MRIRTPKFATAVIAVVIGGSLAMTGCSASNDSADPTPTVDASAEKTTPRPTPTPEPTKEARTPKPEPAPLVLIEDCAAMNSTAYAESTEAIAQLGITVPLRGGIDLTVFNAQAGPSAREAMAQATRYTGCNYPVYLHGENISQWNVEMPEAAVATLLSELRASVYVESSLYGFPVFTHQEVETHPLGQTTTSFVYVFAGDAWIALIHSGALDYTPAAIEGFLAANPHLAGA